MGISDIFSGHSIAISEDNTGMVLQELRSPTDEMARVYEEFYRLGKSFLLLL